MFTRNDLPAVGIWTDSLDLLPARDLREQSAVIEELGYGVLWLPEGAGRDPFVALAIVLSATRRLIGGTGIANIYARDAVATATAARTLAEAFPRRQLIGLGVSHRTLVADVRGHDYTRPFTAMTHYLDGLANAPYGAFSPAEEPTFLLAALRPKMLALAGRETAGAHPYLVTPEHTGSAREILGPRPLLAPVQAVVLDDEPERARRLARTYLATYLAMHNYLNSLRVMGFGDEDFADGGSLRLVEALVVLGDEQAVADRVRAHRDAGADHVALHLLCDEGSVSRNGHWRSGLPTQEWRRLAGLNAEFA